MKCQQTTASSFLHILRQCTIDFLFSLSFNTIVNKTWYSDDWDTDTVQKLPNISSQGQESTLLLFFDIFIEI